MTDALTMRHALEQMVQSFKLKQGGSIEHALFTTFNFDPGFFERNVLPLVCDISVEDLQTKSVDATIRDMYYPLKKTQVAVAYDQGVMQGVSGGGVRYALLPRQLKFGFFHAKLVVLAGQDAIGRPLVAVMVSSGNLTLSGWADNVEVAAWVHASQQDAQELLGFYNWLDSPAELQPGMDILGSITAPSAQYRLFLQYPNHPDGALFSRIFDTPTLNLQIFSPYWSGEAVQRFSSAGKVACYPALRGEKGYQFPLEPVQLAKEAAAIEIRAIKGEERFRHAKAYVWGNRIALGSANCTWQALHTQNSVEAMLRFDGHAFAEPAYKVLSDWSTSAEEEEGVKPCPVQVLVIADYDKRHYRLSLSINHKDRCSEWTLRLGDLAFTQQGDLRWDIIFPAGKPVARIFRLEWQGSDGAGFMTGMIIPKGGNDVELGYRPKRSLERILEDMLRPRPGGGGGGGGGKDAPEDDDPEPDEPELQQDETAFEFDMYGMYQSFFHLRKDIDEILSSKGSKEKRFEIADTLLEIFLAIKEKEVSHVLQRWLMMQECRELARLLDAKELLKQFSGLDKILNKEVRKTLLNDKELLRYKILPDDLLAWVRKELGYAH